jgi:signal transduction histidine kinase
LVAAVALVVFNRRMNRELSLRRRVQGELEQTSERLTRASAEKSELMRMIAHDLRSPLSALRGNTDFLLHEVGSEEADAREALSDMRSSIDRMRTLIGGLTDLHGLESGERPWRWALFDAGEEVRAAALAAGEAARKKGVEIEARVDGDLPGLESDREVFRQIMDNLLANAVKSSPAGSRVRAEVAALSGALRIAVRDEGPAVPAGERKAIFEKREAGSTKPARGESSSGLGLWIVHQLVRSMRGRVWCEDAPEGGAAFCVELPLARAPARADRPA